MTGQCDGCDSFGGRREFLRQAAGWAAGVAMALGISPRSAVALPIGMVDGRRRAGSTGVSYPIPAVDGVLIDKKNETILARHQGSVYAFALSCPHQNTALRWLEDEGRFQCPKHKSRYQPDGTFISGRATRNMDRLPIRREGDTVVVDVEHVFESDKDPAAWSAAVTKV